MQCNRSCAIVKNILLSEKWFYDLAICSLNVLSSEDPHQEMQLASCMGTITYDLLLIRKTRDILRTSTVRFILTEIKRRHCENSFDSNNLRILAKVTFSLEIFTRSQAHSVKQV